MTAYLLPLVYRDGQQPLSSATEDYQLAMYAISPKPAFITQLEAQSIEPESIITQSLSNGSNYTVSKSVKEMVPRPELNNQAGRSKLGLAGHDYVFHKPRFYYRIFATLHTKSLIDQPIAQPSRPSISQAINPSTSASPSSSQVTSQPTEPFNDLFGSVLFTTECEGPPHRVHGGATAAMFDQLLSVVGVANNVLGFTGSITVRYERGVPFNVHLRIHCWVEKIERRKVFIKMTLDDCDAGQSNDESSRKPYATAQGIWISKTKFPMSAGIDSKL